MCMRTCTKQANTELPKRSVQFIASQMGKVTNSCHFNFSEVSTIIDCTYHDLGNKRLKLCSQLLSVLVRGTVYSFLKVSAFLFFFGLRRISEVPQAKHLAMWNNSNHILQFQASSTGSRRGLHRRILYNNIVYFATECSSTYKKCTVIVYFRSSETRQGCLELQHTVSSVVSTCAKISRFCCVFVKVNVQANTVQCSTTVKQLMFRGYAIL